MGCFSSKQEDIVAQPSHHSDHGSKHSMKSAATRMDDAAGKPSNEITVSGVDPVTGHPPSPATTVPTLASQVSRVYTEARANFARDVAKDSQKALLAFEGDHRFQSSGVVDEVTLLSRPSGKGSARVVGGKVTLPAGLGVGVDQVVAFLMDFDARSTWDTSFKRWKVIEKFDDADPPVSICWAATRNLSSVLGDRDFVFAMMAEKLSPSRAVVSYRSLDLVDYPEGKYDLSLTRGTIVNSGYIVEALDGVIFISLFEQIDLGGSAPSFVAERELSTLPLKLVKLHAAIMSSKIVVAPTTAKTTAEPIKSDDEVPKRAVEESQPAAAETDNISLSEEGQRMMKVGLDAQAALLAFQKDSSFKSKGKSGPVELSVRSQNGSEMQVVCGKMNWGKDYTISQVMEFLGDMINKVNWDDQLIEDKVLKSYLNDGQREVTLTWTSYKGEMGVAGRDFIYAAVNEKVSETKGVMTCRSVDLDEFPEHKFSAEACRGFIQNAGYVIDKAPSGDLIVSFYNQVDVRGSVPTWIVNKATMKQPMSLVPAFAAIKHYKFKPVPVAVPSTKDEVPMVEKPQSLPVPEKPEESAKEVVESQPSSEMTSPQAKMALDAGMTAQKALLAFENDPTFKSQGRSGNVDLFVRPQTVTERQVVCGKMSFGKEYTIKQIMQFINDLASKETWDSQFQDGRVLETYSETSDQTLTLTWAAYKKQMGVAGRDFVYAVLIEMVSPTVGVIATRSVNRDDYPEHKFLDTHCRGFIDNAGYVIHDVDGEKIVSFYNQVDVGGSVPTWIVNKAQMKQPMSLDSTFQALKKHKFDPAE
ncbi:hypothetical protein Pmar_PMAR015414 [Perkinsus marinus ATCC 50983]|uniref:START domain-containing protein n=1 Tax=Perkinsus marinus (strain ATCC 50983 / TXsc) TaxID=423536 RepID=C5K9C7_PERM5|nr:hypothetical protein Pmar_PMAR015414 [Perkinsus marinus ATCC 50983]EER18915.1 hypothetical protein Pmar_PMAR015414 [Perkinsus marinus ATCC 50983]|eukprot:XP_002787119.1 hypothetical protein Pmar_PMAR015414 [Perkinsus marinus ATCC 50983]